MSNLTNDFLQNFNTSYSDIAMVGASKTQSFSSVENIIKQGITHIGENYVSEALEKYSGVNANQFKDFKEKYNIKLRLIGHLQSNKVSKAMQIFDTIDSLDSLKLAKKIDEASAKLGKTVEVLLEYNLTNDQNKSGITDYNQLKELASYVLTCNNIKLNGVMAMASLGLSPTDNLSFFSRIKTDFDRLNSDLNINMPILSMGMSNDYTEAIKAGSTMVRIGTKLFGARHL